MTEQLSPQPLEKINEALHIFDNKLNSLKTTVIDENLEKLDLWDNIYKTIYKVNKLLKTNLFGLWTTASLLGISLSDLTKKQKSSKFLNLVFKKYGGIEWLHRTYIDKTLTYFFSDQPKKQELITDAYTTYSQKKSENICSDPFWDSDSFNVVADLWLQSDTDQELIKKLPQIKFSSLSQTLFDTISSQKECLDPNVLITCGCSVPKKTWPNGMEIIDTQSADWHPESIDLSLIQKYLTTTVNSFVENKDFMQNIPSDDHVVLALFGWLFVHGDILAESLLLGVKKPNQFLRTSPSSTTNSPETSSTMNSIDMTDTSITQELQKYPWTPLTAEMVLSSARTYNVPVSYIMAIMKNDSGYGTQWLGAKTHNPGNVGNMDDNSTKDRWTWEAGVDAVAQNLSKRIEAYHTKYWANTVPTLAELSSGKHKDTQEKFYNVYMTAPQWPSVVQNYQQDLSHEPLVA